MIYRSEVNMKGSKYGNQKIMLDGICFDSRKEARRYSALKLLERAGKISDLELQKEYTLIPSQYIGKKCVERAVKYKADFVYQENGKTVVEDTKGMRTKDYIIKRKLMLYIHNIQIKEI
jgi:hypothetical protein